VDDAGDAFCCIRSTKYVLKFAADSRTSRIDGCA
jgi:hypothetical protein